MEEKTTINVDETKKQKVIAEVADAVKNAVNEHVSEKEKVLKEAAKVETVWYKKLGLYVALALGAAVTQFVNTFGAETLQMIIAALQSLI